MPTSRVPELERVTVPADARDLPGPVAKQVFAWLPEEPGSVRELLDRHGIRVAGGDDELRPLVRAVLDENPDPSEEDVRWALSGNLCRCTGYQNIVKSVLWAAAKLRAEAGEA